MDASKLALIISLISSISVVLISAAANIWSKMIDVEQKRQDRSWEFNKAYITRKMDAGELIIGRNNLIISRARTLENLLTAFVGDFGYYYESGAAKIDKEIDESNSLLLTDKASYRLYFDTEEDSENLASISQQCDIVMNSILAKLEEMKSLVARMDEKGIISVEQSNKSKFLEINNELQPLLNEYLQKSSAFKKLLLDSCKYFRSEMNKYDLTT